MTGTYNCRLRWMADQSITGVHAIGYPSGKAAQIAAERAARRYGWHGNMTVSTVSVSTGLLARRSFDDEVRVLPPPSYNKPWWKFWA